MTTVPEQLKRIPSAVRPTVQAARRTVKSLAPSAKEIAYQSEPPRSKSALWKIDFYRGREIDDASGLLEGSGKDMRFTRLRTPADAARPDVRRLVRRAFALEND